MQVLISGDYNAFAEGFNGHGVYMASGLAPSSFERPIYIGSAASNEGLKKRILYSHIPRLTDGKHGNSPMRNYAIKNGAQALVWFLMEPCAPEDCLQVEQKYLDLYRPFCDEKRGFNVYKVAGSPLGYKHSEADKRKISEAIKGERNPQFGKPLSAKQRQTLSTSNETRKKAVSFTHPEHGTHKAESLQLFARQWNLAAGNLSKVLRGTITHHKGWRKG